LLPPCLRVALEFRRRVQSLHWRRASAMRLRPETSRRFGAVGAAVVVGEAPAGAGAAIMGRPEAGAGGILALAAGNGASIANKIFIALSVFPLGAIIFVNRGLRSSLL
jgi:hypothetical protein